MRLLASNSKLDAPSGWQYFLLIGLLAVWACAPAPRLAEEEIRPSPPTALALEAFERADDLYEKGEYGAALSIYQDYLRQFPKGVLVDSALIKTGLVFMATGDYPEARKAFQRLLSRHRRSRFIQDARFNLMLTYYREGDYESAVEHGKSFLGLARTPSQKFRINNLLGYIHGASGQFESAIRSYVDAYRLGTEEERAETLSKVKEVITYLKEPQLESLLQVFGDRVPGGYLRLQLAREYESDDRIETAVEVLSDFIRLFPDHGEIETAEALIEALESRLLVDPFLVGCILPLSGPYGTFGNRALTGIELALDMFNAQPDVHPVQLFIKDSKGDPNEAVMALETFVLKDGVIGIIGPMITSESAAIRAQGLKVPIITLTQKPNITSTGDYVFRNFLTLSLQIKAVVDFAVDDLGVEKFAIFYPDEPYGISFMNRFWDELILHGAEVVGIESYAPDQTDFSDAIKRLVGLHYPGIEERPEEDVDADMGTWAKYLEHEKVEMDWASAMESGERSHDTISDHDEGREWGEEEESQPIIDFEALFIPDSFEKVGLITPQLLFHDVEDVLLLGSNLWHSDRLIEMAGSYVQGAILPDGFFLDSPSPGVQDFVDSYEDVFGRSPAFLEAQAYDAATILFQAVNDPSVRSRRTLQMALMGVRDFSGVTGLTSFDETGDVEKELYLLTVEGRRFVQIRP